MKYFLLLAFVATAAAYYEPGVDLHKYCKVCDDPVVRTFDAAYQMILGAQKTTLSTYGDIMKRCKFGLRVVTKDVDGELLMDWAGFGFDRHKNPASGNDLNYIFGQTCDCVAVRGRQKPDPETYKLPITYDTGKCDNHVYFDAGSGCIELRSIKCEYALTWCCGSCLTFWIGEFYDTSLLGGMCHNANGDWEDDWVLQDGTESHDLQDISDSFLGGSNTGEGFPFGERFELNCPTAPDGSTATWPSPP